MKLSNICKNYFNGFQEVFNFKNQDNKTNTLAGLKILSYFTILIPLGFAAIYGASILYGRVKENEAHSIIEATINDQAKKVWDKDTSIPKVNSLANVPQLPKIELSKVLDTYSPTFKSKANLANLMEYSQSEDYKRHAETARIYYNSNQLAESDALKIVFQREPTNIAMGNNQYNEENLEKLFGYRKGIYNELDAKKMDKSLFKDLPNSAAVYSETYLWSPPGGKNKKEVACLSLPAPALDSAHQPHYDYYMKTGKLDAQKYEEEIAFLFHAIEKAVRDNKEIAFGGKGITRLVLTRFGQGAFLGALSENDCKLANSAYRKQLGAFLTRIEDMDLNVVMSEYSHPGANQWHDKMVIGDIINTARDGDLIINAWDPHSAPGNGNDADNSFDGAMGKGSGILLTQTSWLNNVLKNPDSLAPVR